MATLTGKKIKDTYDSLLKAEDNDVIGVNKKRITDGLGNVTSLELSQTEAKVSGDLEVTGGITSSTISSTLTGDVTGNLSGNVTGDVTGNLTGDVTGNLTGDVTGNVTGDLYGDLNGNVNSSNGAPILSSNANGTSATIYSDLTVNGVTEAPKFVATTTVGSSIEAQHISCNSISSAGPIEAGSIFVNTSLTTNGYVRGIGGVYVGGSSSVNYMQYYYDSALTSITPSYASGYVQASGVINYTRIGDVVHCWGDLSFTNIYGAAYLYGFYLPYARVSGGNANVFGEITNWSGFSPTYPKLQLGAGSSVAQIIVNSSGTSAPSTGSIYIAGGSTVSLEFQISYQVS